MELVLHMPRQPRLRSQLLLTQKLVNPGLLGIMPGAAYNTVGALAIGGEVFHEHLLRDQQSTATATADADGLVTTAGDSCCKRCAYSY